MCTCGDELWTAASEDGNQSQSLILERKIIGEKS